MRTLLRSPRRPASPRRVPCSDRRSSGAGAAGAFTLIELLIVIGIISLLASLVVVTLQQGKLEASISLTRVEVRSLEAAVERYAEDEGVYPGMAAPLDPEDSNQFPLLFEALFGARRHEGGGGGRSAPYLALRQVAVRIREVDAERGLEYVPATRAQVLDPGQPKVMVDPWGSPYLYRSNKGRRPAPHMRNATRFDIYSAGPDVRDDTWGGALESDDIGNW